MRKTPEREKGFEKETRSRRNPERSVERPAERSTRTRIMYIENKSELLNNRGRIGRVHLSKTGKTLNYKGKTFQSLKGGYKANFYDVESGEEYWISGPKKNGGDRLYGTPGVDIDEDIRDEYWLKIRQLPERVRDKTA